MSDVLISIFIFDGVLLWLHLVTNWFEVQYFGISSKFDAIKHVNTSVFLRKKIKN